MTKELERRYRRLLAWYPAEHRHAYEDEMLGVLLAGARPGQRYPGLGETVNLVLSATRVRLRQAGAGFTDSRWADAAAVLGVLASVLMLARSVRAIGYDFTWSVRFGEGLPWNLTTTDWVRAGLGGHHRRGAGRLARRRGGRRVGGRPG